MPYFPACDQTETTREVSYPERHIPARMRVAPNSTESFSRWSYMYALQRLNTCTKVAHCQSSATQFYTKTDNAAQQVCMCNIGTSKGPKAGPLGPAKIVLRTRYSATSSGFMGTCVLVLFVCLDSSGRQCVQRPRAMSNATIPHVSPHVAYRFA